MGKGVPCSIARQQIASVVNLQIVSRSTVLQSLAKYILSSGRPGPTMSLLVQTHFRRIPAEVVDQMVEEGTVMNCAGALMIENPLLTPFITQFQGTKDAIMGLPKSTVFDLVAAAAKAGKNG